MTLLKAGELTIHNIDFAEFLQYPWAIAVRFKTYTWFKFLTANSLRRISYPELHQINS